MCVDDILIMCSPSLPLPCTHTHTHTHTVSYNSAISSGCSVGSGEVVLLDNDGSFRGRDNGTWCNFDDDEEADDVAEEHLAMTPLVEGELKRKLLKRAGKNVSVSPSNSQCHCLSGFTVTYSSRFFLWVKHN